MREENFVENKGNTVQKKCFYQIVRKFILAEIQGGRLAPGDKLPSERVLCDQLSLNRNTVRHGLLMLQREGKIFRLERRGWYVNPVRLIYNPANHVNFARLAESQGMTARWTTEDRGIVAADVAMNNGEGGFVLGTPLYEMVNTFFLDDQKVAYTHTYLDAERLKGIVPKTVQQAMTQVVEDEYDIQLIQKNVLIRPILLPKDITTILNVPHGLPGVYVRRTKADEKARVLTVEHEYWRFDTIELRVDS